MSCKISRVSLIKSLNKKQLLSLLGSLLTFEELKQLLSFNSSEQIIKIISSLYSRESLNDIVNSNMNISTELIFNYYQNTFIYEKEKPIQENKNDLQLFTEIIKIDNENLKSSEPLENQELKTELNSNLKNEPKFIKIENNLANSKTNLNFENKNEEIKNNLANSKIETETKNEIQIKNEKIENNLGNQLVKFKMMNAFEYDNEKMKNENKKLEPFDFPLIKLKHKT
jgi:hypothetical protein